MAEFLTAHHTTYRIEQIISKARRRIVLLFAVHPVVRQAVLPLLGRGPAVTWTSWTGASAAKMRHARRGRPRPDALTPIGRRQERP
jgi:hypothetical protein